MRVNNKMNDIINPSIGIFGTILLKAVTSAQVRGEVTEWISLIGTIVITLTTIGIQVYRLIRDRNKDKEKDDKTDSEDKD